MKFGAALAMTIFTAASAIASQIPLEISKPSDDLVAINGVSLFDLLSSSSKPCRWFDTARDHSSVMNLLSNHNWQGSVYLPPKSDLGPAEGQTEIQWLNSFIVPGQSELKLGYFRTLNGDKIHISYVNMQWTASRDDVVLGLVRQWARAGTSVIYSIE